MGKTINTILNLTDKFTPKLTEAGRQTLVFKQQLKNCNSAATKIDSGLAKLAKTSAAVGAAGVAAMGAFAASSLETYKGFQQSMSNVAGILSVDTTSETYKKLESAAREAGKSTTKTAQESADALSYMALAGWSVEDSMNSLMPILRASEATGADLATTSDLVTDSMSALGLQTSELNHYLDVCARAQNKSNTTLTQMQEAYIACGGTFKNFDTELDESGALLGILANRGIKGAEAGNSLQSTLVNLTKKSGESYKAMKALGVSAYDSQGKFKGVTTTLKELQEKTAGLTDEQRDTYLTMIGGKNQLTTLNALMAGLSNTLPDGTKEFESLREELKNCEGSLDRMADTMTDNYAGSLARAQSATDDLKISIGAKLEPYVTKFLNWFAEMLPDATEKLGIWLDSKIPKAIDFCKSAFEKIKPVVSFVIKNFAELASAGAGVVVGLKAFSIMSKIQAFTTKLSGAMKGLSAAQKLATITQTAFNTSLLACPITWIAVGIGAVVGGVLAWKKHMEKADIAKHFGDITLSAEECSEIVKGVFGSDILSQADEVASAFEAAKSSLDEVTAAARNLNKLNFQLEFGTDIDKESYLSAIEGYVNNLQQLITDERYSVKLNMELLFGGSDFGTEFATKIDNLLSGSSSELDGIWSKLSEDIKKAINEGIDLDPNKIEEQMQKIQEIQERMTVNESEAKLETLKYDFTTRDLSVESFQNLIQVTKDELGKLEETYDQSRIKAIAYAKSLYNEGAIGSDELANTIEEANKNYSEKMAGLKVKGLQFENDAIMGAFPEIGKALKNSLSSLDELYGEDYLNGLADGSIKFSESTVGIFIRALENAFSDVAPETRKRIGKFYELIMPSVEDLQKSMQDMEKVPQSYANVFMQNSAIGAVGGNSKALKNLGITSLSTVLPKDITKIFESSKKYGDAYIKGITTSENGLRTACENMRTILSNTLSKPMTVTVPVTISSIETGGGDSDTPKVDSNAVGTTYFGGGFTTVNEHGYEIMDLPTGTRIYPHSESEKMMNSSPNVSVAVNVYGGIFGIEDAIEVIGDGVCERVVTLVNTM